jgi:hypothetical protein
MDDPEQDPGDLREFLRCRKGDETRAYKLRIVPGGAELWRSTEKGGGKPTLIKEDDFTRAEDAGRTLEELELRLKAGGWRLFDR